MTSHSKVVQYVDPLVQQAIQEAVEREGLVQWSMTPEPPLPPYKPITSEWKPAPKQGFLSSITV